MTTILPNLSNYNSYQRENSSFEHRRAITQMVMQLFDHWHLDTKAQLNLLGMSPSSRAILSKYRQGERTLPDETDKLDRAGLLLLIHKCLRLLFPENPEIVYSWMVRNNKIFNQRPPLLFAMEHGIVGLAKIARYLESELVR